MTKVTEALDRIARQCGVKAPSSWVSATRDDHKELRDDFMQEAIDDILERIDLPSPIGKQQTITGDGSTNYALNSNFKRLARSPLAVYDQSYDAPGIPVPSDGDWTNLNELGAGGAVRYYRVKGYEGNYTVDLYSAPTSGDSIVVSYVSDVWMVSSGGTQGKALTDEEDLLLLPRRVVEAGTVWRFRERRGLPYQDKYMEYEALIARLANDGRTRRVVNMGHSEPVRWQDLVPRFIPES